MTTEPGVYRAPMKGAVDRALEVGVCGFGGVLLPAPDDFAAAVSAMDRAYGERVAHRLERFAAVPPGSFVWTRNGGAYFLGVIEGPWSYDASPGAADVDLVHVRACRWTAEPVPERHVPPATLQTFARGGRNFQQTHHRDVSRQSAEIWLSSH